MAKKGITLGLTVVERDGKLFTRSAHNSQNTHNKERQACMKQQLSGKRGGGKAAQKERFIAAARVCSR